MALTFTLYLWLFLAFESAHCILELPLSSQNTGLHRRATLRPRQAQGLAQGEVSYDQRWNTYGGYYVDIGIGTPQQRQSVRIRTIGSDTWVNSATSTACNPSLVDEDGSCRGGTFNSFYSTTYEEAVPYSAFNFSFIDGRGVKGPVGSDVLNFGSTMVEDVLFGLGEEVNGAGLNLVGAIGLGYPASSSIAYNARTMPYQSILARMVRAKVTASRLFSIALGRADTPGSIIFGGIDSTRYTGQLETLNLINVTEPYTNPDGENTTAIRHFITTITDAGYKSGDTTRTLWSSGSDSTAAWDSDDAAVPAMPETATDYMNLPAEHYDRYIAPRFPYIDDDGYCICNYANTNDELTFTFGGKIKIRVPVRDLIKPVVDLAQGTIRYANGTDKCSLLIVKSISKRAENNAVYLLGGPVLNSMYMVFDQDNDQISIAQAATEVAEVPNVVEIGAGPGQVAKVAASLNPSPTPSSSPSGTNTPRPDPTPVSTGAIAGGVVGGVGGLALIGAAAYFLVRRKRKTQPKSEVSNDFGQNFEGTYVHQPKNPRYNGDPTLE